MHIPYKQFVISDDPELLQLQTIQQFLSQTYWANTRTLETIKTSIEQSICYGVYDDDQQVGFARVVTDGATIYWLADVFIDETYRGQGIAKKLIESIIHSERLKDLRGILVTNDAHALYRRFGFEHDQDRFMMRHPEW